MTQVNAGRPGKPMRADARRNYERLISEAAVAFAEHGERASLDEIAKRAGVGSGTLYRHFPTRRDLLEAVYVDSVESIAVLAGELAGRKPPGEAFGEWLRALGRQMIAIKGLKALLGSVVTDGSSPVMSVCTGTLKKEAGALLAAAQEAGAVRPDLEITELLRLTHAMATAAEMAPAGETAEAVDRYLGLLLDGLRAPGGDGG